MKHITATLLLFFILSAGANAQRIIWSQDFTYVAQHNFSLPWATPTSANSYPWTCDYGYLIGLNCFPYTFNDTKVAGVSSYMMLQGSPCGQYSKPETDVMLVTPVISLLGEQAAAFRYDSYFLKMAKNGKHESATLEVSTDSGATWAVLQSSPVTKEGAGMITSFVNLSAYANSKIRLGFRYSDSAEYMNGWMIDNLSVFVPAEHDIALLHAYPEDTLLGYNAIPANASLSGEIFNMGTAPITAYNIQYTDGVGAVQTHSVSGVNIAPYTSATFVHPSSYAIASQGRYKLKMWASVTGDTLHKNDTLPVTLHGAKFMPTKKVVIEEGTATWSVMAPRGIVYMHALDALDNPPTRITVHSGDVMGHKDYADYLYFLNQNFVPFFLFDRRGPVHYGAFFNTYNIQKDYFGFADIKIKSTVYTGQVSIDATIKPAIDLTGNYRLALVLTEDGVTGSGVAYGQSNAWAGGKAGPMGGFESLPDTVPASAMKYDYVAREISPAPDGTVCLPANMTAGQEYTCNLRALYDKTWNFNKLSAIVLLIREKDQTILNSKSALLVPAGIESLAGPQVEMQLYPNPAHTAATLQFNVPKPSLIGVTVTDITGRTTWQYPEALLEKGRHEKSINTEGWPAGVYFVTLRSNDTHQTLKLTVLH